jgi:hypothetical protein
VTYKGGSPQTITWNPANTNIAPVNATNVKISLSTDGGHTYPYVLAASTENDGSELVTLPSVDTTQGRVKIEAVGNIFFDASNANFTIDATAPTTTISLTPAPVGGYYHNPFVTLSASDNLSGVAVTQYRLDGGAWTTYIAPFQVTGDGSHTLQFYSTDNVGNVESTQSVTFSIDTTPPTLAPSVSPNPVLLNGSAIASPNATDATSGVASASCAAVNTSSVGAKTVLCTATDFAGNTAPASAAYNVIYKFSGFFAPVDNLPKLNSANSGQAIPLKWRITDANGNPVTNLANVTVKVIGFACSLGTTPDLPQESASGNSGLQNQGNGNYQFNWKTPKDYAKSCKTMKLDLGEGPGMERTALFQFVK